MLGDKEEGLSGHVGGNQIEQVSKQITSSAWRVMYQQDHILPDLSPGWGTPPSGAGLHT